jgi:UDP-glucuronate 4-epimerase
MKILITGSAGFIGFHLAKTLLDDGHQIIGLDNLNEYYSPQLKQDRNDNLKKFADYTFSPIDICDFSSLEQIFQNHDFDVVCNLAAQVGVRYSIENPFIYQKSNLEGFVNILEIVRKYDNINNFIFASSSSVYGDNTKIPYAVGDTITTPMSFYGATKIANEVIAYSYHKLYDISTIGLRFFTVYGPWGRPDMAYYKFAQNIVKDIPIDVYNFGKMRRDFTYIDDIVSGIIGCIDKKFDFEIFNLGNNKTVDLLKFIEILEKNLGKKAKKNMVPMQPGDMYETYADITKSKQILGYNPKTDIEVGLKNFVSWFKKYHDYKSRI